MHDDDALPDDWTPDQKALFARMFVHMLANPEMFTYPNAPPIDPLHWSTICWNAAWIAVLFSAPNSLPLVHVGEDGTILCRETTSDLLN